MNYQFNRSWWLLLLLLVMLTPLLVQADTPTPDEALTVEQSDEAALRLTLRQPTPVVQDVVEAGRVWQQVTLDGFETSRVEGAPALPYKQFTVALPVGAVAEVAIVSAETHTLPNITPLPAPQKALISYDASDPDSIPEFEARYVVDSRAAQTTSAVVELSNPYNVRDYRLTTLTMRPIQTDGDGIRVYDELTIEVTFSYPNGKAATPTARPESAAFAGLIEPINASAAQNWRSIPEFNIPAPSPCLGENAYRISVQQTGIHTISLADLPDDFTPGSIADLKMCYDQHEIAVHVIGDGTFDGADQVLFYGESIADREARTGITYPTQGTDTNIYWLTFESGSRKRVEPLATGSGGTPVTSYQHRDIRERDGTYEPTIPLDDFSIIEDDRDHWFWQPFGFNADVDQTVSDTFDLINRVPNSAVTVSAEVWGRYSNNTHKVQLRIAGQAADQTTFFGSGTAGARQILSATTIPATPSTLVAGVEALDNGVSDSHFMLLNWISVQYERTLQAVNGQIVFSQPIVGNFAYNVSGFADGSYVFDVTDIYNPTMLTLADNGFNPSQTATTFPATYALAATDGGLRPTEIVKGGASTLRGSNSADYIIITHPSLQTALEPLVTHRQGTGLAVKTVYVQDIFDEFGFGRYSTEAIRDFLEYAYTNWGGTAPSYVLLAGDASYDHRDILGNNEGRNLVPVYLRSGIDKFIGETASDNQYVAFDENADFGRLPSMHLGRLPASDAAEMQTLVNKVLSYENAAFDINWHGNQLFVSDNAKKRAANNDCVNDPAGNFFAIINALIAQYAEPNGQIINRLFYADCHQDDEPYPSHYESNTIALQSKFTTLIESGQGFVTYVGHAGTRRWADESIVTLSQMENLRNDEQLTIMLPMTCLEGQYHRFDLVNSSGQEVEGMSETMLKNPNGGAVASYAPTGLAVATGHDFLWEGFNEHVFEDGRRIIGQAVFGAKNNLPNDNHIDLHDTFILLGDPAMQLKIWDGGQSVYLPLIRK